MSITPPSPAELKAFRKAVGLSQIKLAEALSVSRRNVEDWEAGVSSPPTYLRLALAAINANLKPWGEEDCNNS